MISKLQLKVTFKGNLPELRIARPSAMMRETSLFSSNGSYNSGVLTSVDAQNMYVIYALMTKKIR